MIALVSLILSEGNHGASGLQRNNHFTTARHVSYGQASEMSAFPETRRGIGLPQVVETLHDQARKARNLRAAGDLSARWNGYLVWVSETERQLSSLFEDPRISETLYSQHHWHIWNLTPGSDSHPRAPALLNDEIDRQAYRLEELAGTIQQFIEWAQAGPSPIAVIDTHVLLHFQPPQNVDWTRIVDSEQVHLLLPLRVVEELDEKKYASGPDLRDRARSLISQLRSHIAADHRGRVQLREDVILEIYVPGEPRQRTTDADQEVLKTCLQLQAAGAALYLVTDDAALDIRARTQKIAVRPMPDKYLRKRPGQN